MGQTLSEPVTKKETSYAQNKKYKVGASCMQGWRIYMEDAHTTLLSIPEDPEAAYFGVFDGHGGPNVAQYAGKNLHRYITSRPEYKQGNILRAIEMGFLDIDSGMLQDRNMKDDLAGTTANIVLVRDDRLYCGNVGDSRCIAMVKGEVIPLSTDHKPNNTEEHKRIVAAGGWVEFNRVNGNLALSRALGDFVFKKNDKKKPEEQMVTAFPDVTENNITDDWEFIVMACDGIWDVMTNEEVADFVKLRLRTGMEPETICEDLMTRCLAPDSQMGGLGCDNMTVIIVVLHEYVKCKFKLPF